MKRVLIVDDEPKIVALARDYLERAGFAVATAYDGKTALAQIRALQPALVLMDIQMPGLTGLQVLKELAHRLEGFKLPDLCLVAEALPLGANGKLDKRALGSFVGDRARVAARRRVPAGAP